QCCTLPRVCDTSHVTYEHFLEASLAYTQDALQHIGHIDILRHLSLLLGWPPISSLTAHRQNLCTSTFLGSFFKVAYLVVLPLSCSPCAEFLRFVISFFSRTLISPT